MKKVFAILIIVIGSVMIISNSFRMYSLFTKSERELIETQMSIYNSYNVRVSRHDISKQIKQAKFTSPLLLTLGIAVFASGIIGFRRLHSQSKEGSEL